MGGIFSCKSIFANTTRLICLQFVQRAAVLVCKNCTFNHSLTYLTKDKDKCDGRSVGTAEQSLIALCSMTFSPIGPNMEGSVRNGMDSGVSVCHPQQCEKAKVKLDSDLGGFMPWHLPFDASI